MGIPEIQMVYNSGAPFSNLVGDNRKDGGSPGSQKAPAGSNLTFESEEAKRQREAIQKKRNIKRERKEMINKDNEEILKLVKEINDDMPEEKQKEIKTRIADLKTSMNKKLKEQEDEKKKEIEAKKEAHKKAAASNKYVSEKVKKKVIHNK